MARATKQCVLTLRLQPGVCQSLHRACSVPTAPQQREGRGIFVLRSTFLQLGRGLGWEKQSGTAQALQGCVKSPSLWVAGPPWETGKAAGRSGEPACEQRQAAARLQDCRWGRPTHRAQSISFPVSPQALHGCSRLSGHPHVGHGPALLPWPDNQALEVGLGQTYRPLGGSCPQRGVCWVGVAES